MSLTAGQIIASSLRIIGVLASGESPSADEASDALISLNGMIDSWSTQGMLIPNRTIETFPMVPSQQTYAMGIGGDFNTARPLSITRAGIQLAANGIYPEIPMTILTVEQWAGVILKTTQSDFPLYLYNDNANPLTNINVWPVPTDSSNNIVIYSDKPLADLSSLNVLLSLPPGYERALRYSLAIELAPEYGKTITENVLGISIASVANIKRINSRARFLQVDDAIRATGGTYNWRTDGYER